MKFLIINADDFGLAEEVNQAIETAHQDGILTSASLLANGNAFDEAVETAMRNPQLGVGIHTALVGGFKPVTSCEKIPTLLDEEGNLPVDYATFIKKDMAGQISYSEVYLELEAQFEKICSSGVSITHADGHQHLHMWPKVLPIVVALCHKFDIRCMRIPQEKLSYGKHLVNWTRFLGKTGLGMLAKRARRFIATENIATTDYFWGMMDGGKLTEHKFEEIFGQMKHGFHEIMCHPGKNDINLQKKYPWNYHWEKEFKALTSPRVYKAMMEKDIHRITFREIRP